MDKAIKYSIHEGDFSRGMEGFSSKAVKIVGPFSGRPEAHRDQHDLYVVISGKARVKTGKLTGEIQEIADGEYRSDEMLASEEFTLEEGESLLIPASVAHTVLVDSGTYVQWVFKIDA